MVNGFCAVKIARRFGRWASRHALDHLEHAAGVVGLLIVVAADDPALVVPEQVDADEAAVEQHLLVRHHDRHDRAADEGGVGREHQIDLVLIEQPVVERLRDGRVALVVVDDHLHGTAEDAALLVHLLEPQVVDRLVVGRRLGEGAGQPERSSDHDRILLRGRRDRGPGEHQHTCRQRARGAPACHHQLPHCEPPVDVFAFGFACCVIRICRARRDAWQLS